MASNSLFPVALSQFSVVLEGPNVSFKLGLFSGCEGLSAEYAFDEVMEGGNNAYVHKLPGRVKYQNVKLTRLINADSMNIAAWFSAYQSRGLGRSTAIITLYDSHSQAGSNILCKWTLKDVHPLKWTGPSLPPMAAVWRKRLSNWCITDLSGRPDMAMRPENLKLARGSLKVVKNPHPGKPSAVWFDFNPAKIATTATAKWEQKAKPGSKAAPVPTFTGTEPQSMELELTLDEWSPNRLDTTVEEDIQTLISWTQPAGPSRANTKPSPPLVELKWGPTWFVSYVTTVKTTINMFDEDGHALRATVNVSLKELPKDAKGQNPTSGSRVGHQSHSVMAGDSLASVAQHYYEKPSYWRGIAIANDIDDPRQLRPGMRLYLPPLTDVAALS